MNGRVNLLGPVLALQLVLVAVLLLADSGLGDDDQAAFLSIDANRVTALDIADGQGNRVSLQRAGEGWVIGASETEQDAEAGRDLPADEAKVTEVLNDLAELRASWPVGTTEETRERFEVTETEFQRRIRLTDVDGGAVELYLGTSPGYRRVHARQVDSDEVYSIDFANYRVPAEVAEWLDRTLLAAQGPISALGRDDGWTLTRDEQGWTVDGAAADQDAAQQLVDRFDDLRVSGLAEAGDGRGADGEPLLAASFTVTDDQGGYRLKFYGSDEEAEYAVTSDRVAGRFSVPAYIVEQVMVDAGELVPPAGEAAEAADQAEADEATSR